MSLQPLIAAAFSNYSVGRSLYADAIAARRSERKEQTENAGQVAGGQVENGQVENGRDVRRTESVRDAGKPRSLSGDVLDLSVEAKQLADSTKTSLETPKDSSISVPQDESTAQSEEESSTLASSETLDSSELTPDEQQQVAELQARDAEVRTHEAAHLSAAGAFATSGASFTYQTGPDGRKYAIGGEVSISTSPVKGDPQATLEKAQTIQRAALAPAEPSGQDQKIAAAAAQMAAKARQELTQQKAAELQDSGDSGQTNALGADAEKSSATSTNSAFQLIRKQTAATSAATQAAASPSTHYSAQSTMSSAPSSKGFSVYA